MTPNWLGSKTSRTAGFNCSLVTNSSANFDRIGVREIGRRSLLTICTGVVFSIGTLLNIFQIESTRCSL